LICYFFAASTVSFQVVSIDGWAKNSRYPFGHFVRCIGELGDRDTENEVILIEQSVPYYW
jgi:exosome complex exonuclease DIS3/RRP44